VLNVSFFGPLAVALIARFWLDRKYGRKSAPLSKRPSAAVKFASLATANLDNGRLMCSSFDSSPDASAKAIANTASSMAQTPALQPAPRSLSPDAALAEVLPAVRVGQSELEIAAALEGALRRRGSEWHPFPTIVASGPRAALPHARTSARVVQAGEWLLLDFGAQVDGYCADLTRTVLVGARADERQRTIYDLVRTAQRRALDHLRAGATGREGDALARDVIAARGFGEAFGHSLGHGLGLDVHEEPRLGKPRADLAPAVLEPGMVFTIEPGAYVAGFGGVRIEDDVLVTASGCEVLTRPPRDFLSL
jgi:Xaa-Pro aminopeptidase